MILPQRIDKHISETSSFKIFSSKIPDSWIIREVTERDYGIDCYIELVNKDNQVTGELISIQLKGAKGIKWTNNNYKTLSNISISNTNYWNRFPTPVFICLVDNASKDVFFCPVKSFIRKNFSNYIKQNKFSYKIESKNILETNNLDTFISCYFKEKHLNDFENQLTTFISHYQNYFEFIEFNIGRDCFLGVEINRVLYLKHFYKNIRFLCRYLGIKWNVKPLNEYFLESRKKYGYHYFLYEEQMDKVILEIEKLMIPVLLGLREIITLTEYEYWVRNNNHLFNVMINVKDDGKMPSGW